MLKLIVVGYDQGRLQTIKQELQELQGDFPQLVLSMVKPNYLEAAIDGQLSLLVFDTQHLSKMIFPFVVQLRQMGYMGPVLALGQLHSSFDVSEIASVRNLFHLSKPYEGTQLVGMAKNCINVEQMRQRRDHRFNVRENATLEAYSSDLKMDTIINNISKSGVRIEGQLQGLKKGDLLRLHFNFDKIKKERTMSARVVWLKKEGDSKEEAGLEFVSQKAVYKYLLDYAVA